MLDLFILFRELGRNLGGDVEILFLEKEHALFANAQQVMELANAARNGLTEEENSGFNSMVAVQQSLDRLAAILADSAEWKKDAESIAIQIQELSSAIAAKVEGVENDPQKLQWLDERISTLRRLKKKYGATAQEIIVSKDKAAEKLRSLEMR